MIDQLAVEDGERGPASGESYRHEMRIFHLVRPDDWARASGAGRYAPPSLTAEGFVHFSFADQVSGTANRLYHDVDALVVIELDSADLSAELRVEDSYGTGVEFPHVYGAIPTGAVLAVHPLTRDADGEWTFSVDGAGAAASPDR